MKKWIKKSSRKVYETFWFSLIEDKVIRPDGTDGIYAFLDKREANFIIPFDRDNREVYFIREFRYPIQREILQLPAGMVDKKNIIKEAKRELFEETGIIAESLKLIGSFYVAPGHETTKINVFLTTRFNKTKNKTGINLGGGDEVIIEVLPIGIKKLKQMISNNEIVCGITLATLNLFFNHIKDEKN